MPTIHSPADDSVTASPLLERADQLAALDVYLASVLQTMRGRMVFIGGEAGVGKSALVRRFCATHATSIRVLTGSCDPLFTPRPLGPLLDIAPFIGGDVQALAERGGRPYEMAAALLFALATERPAILLIEDVHWADEATLDVLRFLARRIESVPALMLITYRDDLERTHPLRILLGELPPGETIVRMRLAPLSPEAVAELAGPQRVDAAELYRKTAGNPFFVTEALAAGDVAIPPTVRDAVLARVARLPADSVGLLESVAIVPLQTELWLLEQLAGDVLEHLDVCLASGILAPAEGAIRFRHELARLAIEDALTPIRRTVLHRRALRALETPPTSEPDLARLVHHAEAAADSDALLRFAPAAAVRAAALGAHREAAAHYARALQVASGLQPMERAEMCARHANEGFLADEFPAAIASGREAAERFRTAGDRVREGNVLRELSYHLRCTRHAREAEEVGMQAVALLEQAPPGRELAMAYANVAMLRLNVDDADGTVVFGQRARALAQTLGDVECEAHVLNTLGTMELLAGVPEGMARLQRSLDLALMAGLEEHVGRVYVNYGWAANRSRSYADFERYFNAGLEYCGARGLDLWNHYVLAYGARCALDQGRWSDAADLAQQVLRDPRPLLARIPALVALALVRARRGDPDAWPLLDEALALAEPADELQHTATVAAARAEAAWLEGRSDIVAEVTAATLAEAVQRGASWVTGELACWRWRAGVEVDTPHDGAAEPYALEIGGNWTAAAHFWEQRGCPYEAALARAGAVGEEPLREALSVLQQLGAHVTARVVARRLRELGALDLPRGPRASTRTNDAHLTARELEVIALIVQGLSNADIATRLYLAPKTVEHHVSAIFAKLQVHSRAEAIAQALTSGLVRADAAQRIVH